jgi:hypothetical protein
MFQGSPNRKSILLTFVTGVFFGLVISFLPLEYIPQQADTFFNSEEAEPEAPVGSIFHYQFQVDGHLQETGSADESSSPYWWLNSGGELTLEDGVGKTIQKELSRFSRWRLAYAKSNAEDTDNGTHPQNIFRLFTRSRWQDARIVSSFQINKINLSESPNRNASNGFFLVSRYHDSDNLYYAGLRVDGAAVIKKKIHGDYHTLGYIQIYPGEVYDRSENSNLLPVRVWLDIRSEVKNIDEKRVEITLAVRRKDQTSWMELLRVVDDGENSGGEAHTGEGLAGIRSDFMDLEFDDFRIEKL